MIRTRFVRILYGRRFCGIAVPESVAERYKEMMYKNDQKSNDVARIHKGIFLFAALWSVAVLLIQCFADEIIDRLWILDLIPFSIELLWGLGLLIWTIVRFCTTRFQDRTAIAVFCLMFVTGLCFYHNVPGWLRWNLDQLPRYEKTITRLRQAPHDQWETICHQDDCSIDESSGSLLVYFVVIHGMVDNFSAIVYDPSGRVMRADQSKDTFSFDSQVASARDLCGGFLSSARPLGGPWYWCMFE